MKKLFLLLLATTVGNVLAQINPVTLKATIDTDITNKTAGTVTRASTGVDMKAMVDYTTQQSNLKQNILVSGTSIKTLETISLLGSGNIDLIKSNVGLSNVDDTSDINKPVSTAQQSAIDLATFTSTKVRKTTITQSQILTLNDVPIEILPESTNPLVQRILLSVFIKRSGAGTNYTAGANLYVSTRSESAFPIQSIFQNVLTSTSFNSIGIANGYYEFNSSFPNSYKLHANVGNPSGGTGDIDVYATYIEIPL